MIWGRLDCADRMITALLRSAAGDTPLETLERERLMLVQQAQEAILLEEVSQLDASTKAELGFNGAMLSGSALPGMSKAAQEVIGANLSVDVKEYLMKHLQGETALGVFALNYKRLHVSNLTSLLSTAGRGVGIMGDMLDELAEKKGARSSFLSWIIRMMGLTSTIIQIGISGTSQSITFRRGLKLIIVIGLIKILAGNLFPPFISENLDFAAFGLALIIYAVLLVFGDLARGSNRYLRIVAFVAGVASLLAIVLGILLIIGGLRADSLADFGHSFYQLVSRGKVR